MDTLVDDGEPWIGIHRGIGGVHRRVLRHRHWFGRKAWPVVAFAALAASVGLFLSTYSRPEPHAGQIVQIPGPVVTHVVGGTITGGAPPARANGSGGSVGAAAVNARPPAAAGQPLSRGQASPPPAASPSSSPLTVEVPPLPPVPTTAVPCPMPTRKHPKGKPSSEAS